MDIVATQYMPAHYGDVQIVTQYHAEAPYTALWYNNFSYYGGVNATFPPYQRPMAVYEAAVDKTFFVWANGTVPSWATIVAFNHATGEFEGGKKIFQFVDGDAHRTPAMMIDRSGYIYVFAGSHVDTTQVWRSTQPYSTASFVRRADIAGGTTYPQPHDFGQYKRVFLRKGQDWGSVWSGDGFSTVSPFRSVVTATAPDAVYAITESDGDDLYIMWTVLDFSTQVRKNVWFAQSHDGGVTFQRADGTPVALPINGKNSAFLALDTGTDQVNIQDMIIHNGAPVLLASHGAVGGCSWSWKVIRIVDGAPVVSAIPAIGDRQFDCGALIEDDGVLAAILPTGAGQVGQDGGNLEEYVSTDGGATWTFGQALTADPLNNNNVKRVKGVGPMKAFWGYGDATKAVPGSLRFMDDQGRIEAIRPGDPFARSATVSVGGNPIWSGSLGDSRIIISVDPSKINISK